MGATAVEKILARASGQAAVKAGDVVEPRVDLAMSHENAALVINQFREIYEGTGLAAKPWDPSQHRDHLRSPRPRRVGEDRDEPEAGPRVRRRARDHEIPRRPWGRRRHLPPDPAGARLRAARHGRRRDGLPHDEPRRARRVRVRDRRHGDGERVGARRRPQRRGPPDDPGLGLGPVRGSTSGRRTSSSTSSDISPRRARTSASSSSRERRSRTSRRRAASSSATCRSRRARQPGSCRATRRPCATSGRRRASPIRSTSSRATRTRSTRRRSSVDVSKLEPLVACPHTVDNVKPVSAVAGKPVQQVVIGSCTNGRLDDLAEAAAIVKGRHVAAGTRMLVFPASGEDLGRGVEARVSLRLHGGGRRRHECGLRPVPRRPRRRAR